MGTPFFQTPDPAGAPDPVTPSDAPSSPDGYAGVTPPGTGLAIAPYSISAPQDIAGIGAAVQAAMALTGGAEGAPTGAGIPDRDSPRQREAAAILDSPQGAPSSDVFAGFPDYESSDISPGVNLETPIQGHGFHPDTTQPGVPQFTAGLGPSSGGGLPGVPPESGNMGPSTGGNYPGTVQDGLTTYGTS
jgi:hypothetical protein